MGADLARLVLAVRWGLQEKGPAETGQNRGNENVSVISSNDVGWYVRIGSPFQNYDLFDKTEPAAGHREMAAASRALFRGGHERVRRMSGYAQDRRQSRHC